MKNVTLFIALVILVIAMQFIGGYIIYYSFNAWSDRGTFGDMFGAINTLFSGLAFVGIIYAIFLQHKELSLQRQELESTRKELQRSAEAQEKSELALSKQADALLQTAKLNSLNLVPNIILKITTHENKVRLHFLNVGNTSAFDVDIIALGLFSTTDIDQATFIEKYVWKTGEIINRIESAEDEIYGVFDHLCYAVFPQRRKIICDFTAVQERLKLV